jgi:hypothetical protein
MALSTSTVDSVFQCVDGFEFLEGLELDFNEEQDPDELTDISDILLQSKVKSNLCPTLKRISTQGRKTYFEP